MFMTLIMVNLTILLIVFVSSVILMIMMVVNIRPDT